MADTELERELVVAEIWRRLSLIPGIKYHMRNPQAPPKEQDMPCCLIFDMDDVVVQGNGMGTQAPTYKRALQVVVESFVQGSSEAAASKELMAFVRKLKREIYRGGSNLGKICTYIGEKSAARILNPRVGTNVIGLGIVFEVMYVEDISKIT
jgi:hypothetical protein